MCNLPADPEALLRELAALPERDRIVAFQCCCKELGGEALTKLCGVIERMVVAEIAAAVTAAAVLVQLSEVFGDDVDRGRALRVQGMAWAYSGDFSRALEAFSSAIDFAQRAGAGLEEARSRMSSVHAFSELGRYAEAEQAGEQARSSFQAAGESELAARADANLGTLALSTGRPAAALEYFDRAKGILNHDTLALAQIESNRGKALMLLDRHQEARRAWETALPVFSDAAVPWAAAIVEGNLAELDARQGRLQPALQHFERARRHLERDEAPAEMARIMGEQADVLSLSGLFEDASRIYREAIPVLEASGVRFESAKARLGLTEALLKQQRLADAHLEYESARAAVEGLDHVDLRTRSLLLESELALQAGSSEAAAAAGRQALSLCEGRPVPAVFARIMLSRVAEAQQDRAAARSELDQAFSLARQLQIRPLMAEVLHARGRLQQKEGDPAAALRDFQEAVHAVEHVRGSLQSARFRMAFQGQRVEVYDDLIRTALYCGAGALAFDTAERAKSRGLLEAARRAIDSAGSEISADPEYQALASALSVKLAELDMQYSRLADARFKGSDEALGALAERVRNLENDVSALDGRLHSLAVAGSRLARPSVLADIQSNLAANEALLMYYQLPERLAAFVVRPDSLKTFELRVAAADVANAVQRVLFQIRKGLRGADFGESRAARRLADVQHELHCAYQMLVAPLEAALEGAGRLRLVPHGPLHAAPLHALWSDGRYFLERFEISYSPNASLSCGGQAHLLDLTRESVLLVAVADRHAPQIAAEVEQLRRVLPQAEWLMGAAAEASAVAVAGEKAAVLHLACHGHFSADKPAASGIRLHDRWWTASAIRQLRMRARLVTLSGCDTGRSEIQTGDEILGLVRAFLAAGAQALVVSLWTVQDVSTAELMIEFYSRLSRAGPLRSLSCALREAQLSQMKSRPHPAGWASFVCIGG